MSSWWCTIEDILWPEKKVSEKIKRRAEGFARAGIDTAINFGFHTRFDFSNYFGSLHGYLAEVCTELHKYGIKFMDHYSCNIVERPRGDEELRKLHTNNRHHILLHPDTIAAEFAQYEGYRFQDICEIDIRDGSRAYNHAYSVEMFCHNNPDFRDMNKKYLKRLMTEVPMDGIQVDDMCDYGGLSTCACRYCRERFRKEYSLEIPPYEDKSFWGDTSGGIYTWGNYENPAFRDFLRMKEDSVADHVKMIKDTIGDMPLMTCCSSTGPMMLNGVSLNLERMMGSLDLVMLENCGLSVDTVNWGKMDAEALQQKDIADKMGNAPAIALSYTIYDPGAYLGWCLARFWGVVNWCSTLTGRLESEPEDAKEIHELIGPLNNWELQNSNLKCMDAHDVAEVRLVNNRFCKENGWRDENGQEHWNRVQAWSMELLENNVGYRFVRAEELADISALKSETTPVVMDGVACVSDAQYDAIREYLGKGGNVWLRSPFGTHDGKGFKRDIPLYEELLAAQYPGLKILHKDPHDNVLKRLIESGEFVPRIKLLSGDSRWAARLRVHPEGIVLHLMNRALEGVPHQFLRGAGNIPVLLDIKSGSTDNKLEYTINFTGLCEPWAAVILQSPEIGSKKRAASITRVTESQIKINLDMDNVKIYGVVQQIAIS